MIPIRQGDGTGISSIRLGDGTNIGEVRKGDGTVLWSAGSAIPDSGLLHEYDARELSLTNDETVSTYTDLEGANDLSANGAPLYKEGSVASQNAVLYDGTDDSHNGAGFVGGSNDEYTLAFVVKIETVQDSTIISNDLDPRAETRIRSDGSWDATHMQVDSLAGGSVASGNTYAGVQTYDGSNVQLQIGDDLIIDTSLGTSTTSNSDNFGLAEGNGGTSGSQNANILFGHGLAYNEHYGATGRDDIISGLESSWGFTTPDAT